MNPWYVLMIYSVVFLILITATTVFLVKIIIAVRNKKVTKKVVISFISSIVLLTVTIIFYCSHSTYYKYNDWLILGSNIEKVQKRYGEFDLKNSKTGYYIYTDNGPIMPNYLEHYYYIEYDEDGIVYNVYVAPRPGG